ncbi:glycoside hydrolase family 43 protein [Apodospora peruviana]|uniref:Arabinan endo-1,5-alpha-L-arabinosidase n=1 Tax=Apodospora peruviana TaxID=516989 RepID=A0AAE0IRF2_9PEZI|nr:glycoside hydrolase family 43 protein [Apodospora peruviana]
MVKIGFLFGTAALFPRLVLAYILPEACTGTCTNSHDPSIIRRASDGLYFRFSTGGKIAIHTAPDLTGPWTYKGAAVPRGSSINLRGNQDLWAPDISQVGDQYYLYYAVSTFGSQDSGIGLAKSYSMDVGTWTDVGSVGVISNRSKPYNAIDANLFVDYNSSSNNYRTNSTIVTPTYILTFGSWWNGLFQVQMNNNSNPTPTSIATTVANGSSAVYTQISYDSKDKAQEAAYLFKDGNYYYLFYSKGSCCGYDRDRPARGKEYRILVCRSTRATGGFADKTGKLCTNGGGTMVLESHDWVYGPGGQGVYRDPVFGPVLYYHYIDTRVGYSDGQKRFGWNKINFSSGWPVV